MEQYICCDNDLRELLLLIATVIGKPICFYDAKGTCLTCPPASSVPSGEYCTSQRRKNPAFLKACLNCDMQHIRHAEKTGIIMVYRCHAGLYDCVVPIFDPTGRFLGGFIVGQQRDATANPPETATAKEKELYWKLEPVTPEQLMNVGNLLKKLSEYILSHELLGYRKLPWAEAVDLYLKKHCTRNVTLAEVSKVIGYSASFLTHRFSSEFHMSFKCYQKKLRMEYAMSVLLSEQSVKTTAEKSGFANQFIFSAQFKEFFGNPPSYYLIRPERNK